MIEEHYQVLSEILPILQNAGVILNTPTCKFFQTNVEYLGFLVTHIKIGVKNTYLGKIVDWLTSCSLKNLESYLGFLQYYHYLILYFSDRVFNLSEL